MLELWAKDSRTEKISRLLSSVFAAILTLVLAAGCGGEAGANHASQKCQPADDSGVAGQVFTDVSSNAESVYKLPEPENRAPLSGISVKLYSNAGTKTTETCGDGYFRFDSDGPSTQFLSVEEDDARYVSTTSNDPEAVPDAIEDGQLDIVAFGDSLPTFGEKPYFPSVMSDHFEDLDIDVQVDNVAVPGAVAGDWLPEEGDHYEDKLKPELGDADLAVFSLGGNDFAQVLIQLRTGSSLEEVKQQFTETRKNVVSNLKTITDQLREDSPDTDIVWVLYPNYARSDNWGVLLGDNQEEFSKFMRSELVKVRQELSGQKDLIVADMLEATESEALSPLLSDSIHLNKRGHKLFAKEIYYTLGGVIDTEETEIGSRRFIGFRERGSGE